MRDYYIDKISYYQDILRIVRDKNADYTAITEFDSVYQDILDYQENEFDGWYTKDFQQFIQYLKELIIGGLEVQIMLERYTLRELSDLIIDYIEHYKENDNIPYYISINTLEHLFDEIKEKYKDIKE